MPVRHTPLATLDGVVVNDIVERLRTRYKVMCRRCQHFDCDMTTPHEVMGAAADDIDRLRGFINTVVSLLQNEDGDQLPFCAEPERTDKPQCTRQSDGLGFDLCHPFTDEFWAELCEVAELA